MEQSKARILLLSPMPHHFGGLANNMKLYLSSKLADEYDLIRLNTVARLSREKDPDNPSLITGLYAVAVLPRLTYMLATLWPDLVYVKAGTKWGFFRDGFIIILCKSFRRKLVCHLHSKSSGTLFLRFRIFRTIFRWVMKLPDKVIVLSEQLKNDFSELISREKLEVIDNIVDTTVYDRHLVHHKSALISGDQRIKVLFVGRMSHNKGVSALLDAIPVIVSEYPNVEFQLAGLALNETEEIQISQRCLAPPFDQHVVLLGGIEGDVKIKTFLDADIFVLPTLNDNVPNVILEAFAAGLPVISTRVGQIPSMIEDGVNGFVVEPGDSQGLVERLMILVRSSERRKHMAKANYKKAREKYSVEAGVKKMSEVFEELLDRRRSGNTEAGVLRT